MELKKASDIFDYPLENVSFSQNVTQVFDSEGNRLVLCAECGKIGKTTDFVTYGGKNSMNCGLCFDCYNRRK